ncbi:ATP-binding protein [Oceanibium sediminis]|uniref:ATP-binding protein n=1 Tax=Oceanibium sediminis TaxID=2026339 RepID=UPI000DD41229|nr:ATP-binding protein [Oceanibium sediminis]
MTTKLLARAVAAVCSKNKGLAKIILPRSLPVSFKTELSGQFSNLGGKAVRVGSASGEVSLGEAISYRTPEGSDVTASVLLIATEGEVRELKSLETFRDVLVGGLPGGVMPGEEAIVRAPALAEEVANLLSDANEARALDKDKLAEALGWIFSFLAQSYEKAGNGEKRWTEAYWLHLDMLADRLGIACWTFSKDIPNRERRIAFACAGLPSPSGSPGFGPSRKPETYAKIIDQGWSEPEDIELSLLEVQEQDGIEGGHPLAEIEWGTFITTRTTLGHPILALAFHGQNNDPALWLHAWASTSEQAFFDKTGKDEITYELFSLSGDAELPVPAVQWRGVDHVLPPAPGVRLADGLVAIGAFKLVLDVHAGAEGEDVAVDLDCKPASACKATVISSKSLGGKLEIQFDLGRKIARRGGKWRERPFTLNVVPARIHLDTQFRESISLKLCTPNPTITTVLAIEQAANGGEYTPSFPSDLFLEVAEGGVLVESPEADVIRDLTLSDNGRPAELVVVGQTAAPTWSNGAALPATGVEACDWLRTYEIANVPDDAIAEVAGIQVSVTIPLSEKGQVNPFQAAYSGEPVVPPDDALSDEMALDPRFVLEEWLRDNVILDGQDGNARACLGSCLVEVGASRVRPSLEWDPDLGAFTNAHEARALEYPAEVSQSAAADGFWRAFLDLRLKDAASGPQSVAALPSMLDLRKLEQGRVETYLAAFENLLAVADSTSRQAWAAYPFSALLFDTSRGHPRGVLLSPLHPVRLAWAWSAQQAGHQLQSHPVFKKASRTFLRFVDGEMFPEVGPSTNGAGSWISTGLSAGPREIFAGWSLLSGIPFETGAPSNSIELFDADLPFGTPSGLDQGGVSSALRDYLRIYPASQQLRIGLAAPSGGKRFAETDDAIIAAAANLLSQRDDALPGGVRIVDAGTRGGKPPSAAHVLTRLQAGSENLRGEALPSFEWTTAKSGGAPHAVDLQFIEDSVVTLRTDAVDQPTSAVGTAGPALPVNRFRSWQLSQAVNSVSTFAVGLADTSFIGLKNFDTALTRFESLQLGRRTVNVEARMQLAAQLLGTHANWTISGNRNLSPAVLSTQLSNVRGNVALWEWRPAFLARQTQKSAISAISSTHPYTVLAKPSEVLKSEIKKVLGDCGMADADEDVRKVIANLGVRGVGLSSLLTMGHTQSLGALGFDLAFQGLATWEEAVSDREVRCIVPMDSVYPLIDLLGEGARTPDDQRRADLLLLSLRMDEEGGCHLRLHPVEIKMRSKSGKTFPPREKLSDPFEQLDSTFKVLEQGAKNISDAQVVVAVKAALASLVEAAFSLRPASAPSDPALEARLLAGLATSDVAVHAERGTLLWLQVGGESDDGLPYQGFLPEGREPGGVLVEPAAFSSSIAGQVKDAITAIVDSADATAVSARASCETAAPPEPSSEAQVDLEPANRAQGAIRPAPEATSGTGSQSPKDEPNAVKSPVEESQSGSMSQARSGGGQPFSHEQDEGVEVLVGHQAQGSRMSLVQLKLSETALSQLNIGVVGDLGTGKTQFLKSLVYQVANAAKSNRGVAPKVFVFDYKRDYSEGDYPSALGAQVLDPAKAPLPINFFAIDVERLDTGLQMERVRRANFFCDLLRRISRIGVVQRNDLYDSVMKAYDAAPEGEYPTIDVVFEQYKELGKNDSVVSVLRMLTDLRIFESDPTKTLSFVEIFDRNTVLSLSGISGAGQDIVDIVATMFLDNLYTDYMKTRVKAPFLAGADGKSRRQIDSFVLIDEAHHAMGRDFEVLMKLMLEGREFGMGVILSSQYLSHFETSGHNWAEALSTWVVHNVRNATKQQFERIGFRSNVAGMVEKVTQLETHWAFYRCMHGYNEGILMKGQPFFSLQR